MKTNHTPAPWLQSWDCDAPTGSDASPKYEGFEVTTDSGWPIAFLPINFVFPPVRREMNKRALDWDEASANLRLISSAPELLQVLKRIVLNPTAQIGGDMRAEAIAAIAKATGEQA
jgi:hypothetical protein